MLAKTLFAISEFANIVRASAKALSSEALLCANLGFRCRLVSTARGARHTICFDTGPECGIFIRNLTNLGIGLEEIECIAGSHGVGTIWAPYPRYWMRSATGGGKTAVMFPSHWLIALNSPITMTVSSAAGPNSAETASSIATVASAVVGCRLLIRMGKQLLASGTR
jgi:hypothetical protein